jgi:hypothetical protein
MLAEEEVARAMVQIPVLKKVGGVKEEEEEYVPS